MAALGTKSMSAVDAIIAEAADLIALEQIAALNTAHLSADSSLSSNLESRFRKLKSLPNNSASVSTLPSASRRRSLDRSGSAPARNSGAADAITRAIKIAEEEEAEAEQKNTAHNKCLKNELPPQAAAAVSNEKARCEGIQMPKQQPFRGSSGGGGGAPVDRDFDWEWDIAPSPPKQGCCFVFSPKKSPRTRSKSGGERDDLFGELGADSKRMVAELKEQQRKLKKALREQEKVSQETAKMTRWVKQASARMTHTATIDDLLSDDEEAHEFN